MALPADSLNKIKAQNLSAVLDAVDDECRVLVPHIWEGYFTLKYGHSPEASALTTGQRKLRILGCVLNVAYDTDDTTTEGNIVTAVQALIS